MTQADLVYLAQCGDGAAIAALMNITLQTVGIQARVVVQENHLHVLLESDRDLAPQPCIEFIHTGIGRLRLAWLSSVIIYSHVGGQISPSWVRQIDFAAGIAVPPAEAASRQIQPIPEPPSTLLPDLEREENSSEIRPLHEIPPGLAAKAALEEESSEIRQFPIMSGDLAAQEILEEESSEIRRIPAAVPASSSLAAVDGNPATNDPETLRKSGSQSRNRTGLGRLSLPLLAEFTHHPLRSFNWLLLSLPLLVGLCIFSIWGKYLGGDSPNQEATQQNAPIDPYLLGLQRAENATKLGSSAQTKEEWMRVAENWRQGIIQMQLVPESHPQYAIAQQKLKDYQLNLNGVMQEKLLSLQPKKVILGEISPKSIVFAGGDLFFAPNGLDRHTISVYDRQFNLVKTLSDQVRLSKYGYSNFQDKQQGAPVEAAATSDGRFLWVANYRMTGKNLKQVSEDGCTPTSKIAPSFLYRINTNTLRIDRAVQVGATPQAIATTPNNRFVLASNWCSWDISVVDTQKNQELRRVAVGAYPRGVVVDANAEKAYVAVLGSNSIAKVDLQNFSVEQIQHLGKMPHYLVLDPGGKYLYVSLSGEGQVAKLDLANKTVVGKVATGDAPRTMAIAADGKFLYVANYTSATVSKIRTEDFQVVQTVKVNPAPVGITYDPQTRQVWVACYSGSIMVFQD